MRARTFSLVCGSPFTQTDRVDRQAAAIPVTGTMRHTEPPFSPAQSFSTEHHERCQAAYDAREPVPRDVMRHRIGDHLGGYSLPMTSSTRCLAADLKHSPFYSEDEIDLLRERPPAEDPAEQARVHAILEEWDRWSKECAKLADETGLTEALEFVEDLVPKQRALAKRIATASATTLAGLQVRALIIAETLGGEEPDDDDYTDQLMIRAIVRDLVRIET
jgi:hypothetical protein